MVPQLLPGDGILDFINEHIVHSILVNDPGTNKDRQLVWISQFRALVIVQCNLNDAVILNALLAEIVPINLEQEKALPATTETADDLDQPVLTSFNELLEV